MERHNGRKYMTNHQLVKRYKALRAQASKLVDWFCGNDMGHLCHSDMLSLDNPCNKVITYLKVLDEMGELKDEAQRRYGPDLKFVEHLI